MKRLSAIFIILFLVLASCSGKLKNIAIGKSFAIYVPREVEIHREPVLKGETFHLEDAEGFVVEDVVCEGGGYGIGCVLIAIDFPEVFFYKARFESGKVGYINGRYFLPELVNPIISEEVAENLGTTPKEFAAQTRQDIEDGRKEVMAEIARGEEAIKELERTRLAAIDAAPWPDEVKQKVVAKKVEIGMRSDQVLLAWGPPNKIVDIDTEEGNQQEWTYGVTTLYFKDLNLVRMERTLKRPY